MMRRFPHRFYGQMAFGDRPRTPRRVSRDDSWVALVVVVVAAAAHGQFIIQAAKFIHNKLWESHWIFIITRGGE